MKSSQFYAQSFAYSVLVKLGADNAKATDNACAAETNVALAGNVVEVDPSAVVGSDNSLCAQNHSVLFGVGKAVKSRAERVCVELLGGLRAEAYEYLVGVVMVVSVLVVVTAGAVAVLVVLVMMMLVLVIVAMALLAMLVVMMMLVLMFVAMALLAVLVMMMLVLMFVAMALLTVLVMMMLVLMFVAMALLAVLVMMLMLVLVAMALLTVLVMMLVMAALVVMMVMVLVFIVIMTAALAVVVMSVMMVMSVRLYFKLVHFCFKGGFSLHSFEKLCAGQLLPRGGNDNRDSVMLFEKRYAICNLLIGHFSCVAEYDAACILNLIVKELAKVLHVHLALVSVNNGGESVKNCTLGVCIFNRLYNVGKLTNARRLDKDAVGSVFVNNLLESDCKVANERATDTTRVHFVDLNSRLSQKSAVNTDLTEFILDKNYFFAVIGFFNKLFDKCGLSRTEKARKYVNFSHFCAFLI